MRLKEYEYILDHDGDLYSRRYNPELYKDDVAWFKLDSSNEVFTVYWSSLDKERSSELESIFQSLEVITKK